MSLVLLHSNTRTNFYLNFSVVITCNFGVHYHIYTFYVECSMRESQDKDILPVK